jgi:RNA polymerase sigma factor (sigma-70 family)
MTELSDRQLLGRIRASQDRDALGELARRYVGLVYSAALRQIQGDAHLAEDITQAVFIVLVRKAASIREETVLPAWLFTVTRHAAANARRVRQRREYHETRKTLMSPVTENAQEQNVEAMARELRPMLDDVIGKLPAVERSSVLLHFFGNKTYREVGRTLGLTEEAVRKRISRGLEKMRMVLEGRGVGVASAMALGSLLSAEAASAAAVAPPAALIASTVNVALLAQLTSTNTAAATIAQGVARMLVLSKAKVAAMIAASVLITGGIATPLVTHAGNFFRTAPAVATLMTIETNSNVAAPTSQPSFSAEVNKQTRVTLVGVSDYPGDDNSWFAPDGTPIPQPSELPQAHFRAQPEPNHQLLLSIEKPAGSIVQMKVHGAHVVANNQNTDDITGATVLLTAFTLDNDAAKTASIEVGISDGHWQTVAMTDKPKEASESEAAGVGAISFDPAEDVDGGTKVVIHHAIVEGPSQVAAIDDKGKEYKPKHVNVNSDGQTWTGTYGFDVPLDKVQKIVFQTRPITKYVDITDISLEKETMTKPKMTVRDAGEEKGK